MPAAVSDFLTLLWFFSRRGIRSSGLICGFDLLLLLGVGAPGQLFGDGNSWSLVWSDEFNGPGGSGPDTHKWHFDIGGGGWGNQELESYTNRLDNAFVADGKLVIKAIKENYTGPDGIAREYTSARIKTQGKFTQAYGRFEARIKIPYGQGIWPAFWMLGEDIDQVDWPACGEIDIMENIGREPSIMHGTIHGPGYSGANGLGAPFSFPDQRRFTDDFHIYAIEWEPGAIRFYVDDSLYSTRTPADLPSGTRWVYDHPFFMILNVAVGGSWPGSPDSTTVFPQTMQVDYVRVYQRASVLPDGPKLLPSAARAHGLNGTYFTTDVWLSNASDSPMTLNVDFLRAGGTANIPPLFPQATVNLAGHETRVIPDILGTLFSVSQQYGPIRFNSIDGKGMGNLAILSRTSTPAADGKGSYGLSMPARSLESTISQPLFLVGLSQNTASRTNVGVINCFGFDVSYRLTLYSSSGSELASVDDSLPPLGAKQLPSTSLFSSILDSSVSYDGLTVKIIPDDDTPLAAYATPVDNFTGDGVVIYGTPAPGALSQGSTYLPAVTKVDGAYGTRWSSRLAVHNPGDLSSNLSVSLHIPNTDNSHAPAVTRTLGPKQTLLVADVVGELLGMTSGNYGALQVEWSSSDGTPPVFSSQTSTPSGQGQGTYGLQVDSINLSDTSNTLHITGVRQDERFRTNIGFANPIATGVTLNCALRAAAGTVLATATRTMQPLDYFQFSLPSLFQGVSFPGGEVMSLEISASSAVFAYGTLIDNSTQDPTYLPAEPTAD